MMFTRCFFSVFLFHYNVHHTNREGNHPDDYSRLTYRKLLEEVCRFANVLKMHGVNKGDRVSIYMPMIMELPIAMLACARIGAVHSIVVSIIKPLVTGAHFDLLRQHRRRTRDPIHSIGIANARASGSNLSLCVSLLKVCWILVRLAGRTYERRQGQSIDHR